jgi:hypothetical protein
MMLMLLIVLVIIIEMVGLSAQHYSLPFSALSFPEQVYVIRCKYIGHGCERVDFKEALKWWERAANGGSGEACNDLAMA